MNIYYNPEKFGLEKVGMIDFSSGQYEFDYTVVWKDKKGKFFWASDSGCSCPTPFEDTGLDDLTEITVQLDFKRLLNSRVKSSEPRTAEIANLLEKIR